MQTIKAEREVEREAAEPLLYGDPFTYKKTKEQIEEMKKKALGEKLAIDPLLPVCPPAFGGPGGLGGI